MSDDNQRTPESGESTDDRGFSLIDLIVATSIMSVVMVMATGAIMQIYSDVNRTEGISFAREDISSSFRRLDKELRYAHWVNEPGERSGAFYVEWATSTDCRGLEFKNPTVKADGTVVPGSLKMRTWAPGTTPGEFLQIASNVVQSTTVKPFTLYYPGDRPYATASPNTSGVGATYELEHAQMRLRFTASVGKTSLPQDVLFTARNTNRNNNSRSNPVPNPCSDGRPS
jgi:type II secretory pathway pseudopilin PulG